MSYTNKTSTTGWKTLILSRQDKNNRMKNTCPAQTGQTHQAGIHMSCTNKKNTSGRKTHVLPRQDKHINEMNKHPRLEYTGPAQTDNHTENALKIKP